MHPAADWDRWDLTEEAGALHGLTRERLRDEGQPVTSVAFELTEVIAGRRLIADSDLDSHWMRTLMAGVRWPNSARQFLPGREPARRSWKSCRPIASSGDRARVLPTRMLPPPHGIVLAAAAREMLRPVDIVEDIWLELWP